MEQSPAEIETADQPNSLDWRGPALIIAALFLNLPYWSYSSALWRPGEIGLDVAISLGEALLLTAIFFLGPALSIRGTRRSIFDIVESSLGSIPAVGLRLCCMLFLVYWIAGFFPYTRWFFSAILRRDSSSAEFWLFACILLAFLFVTALQSSRTNARIALFTNKLSIAILIAALIRVRDGWSARGLDIHRFSPTEPMGRLHSLANLSFYVAPLALLAAGWIGQSRDRKEASKIVLWGFAVPLAATLLVVGAITTATASSRYYQPSLSADVTMALLGKVPGQRRVWAGIGLLILSTFGAIRFGARALAESASIFWSGRNRQRIVLAGLIAITAWLATHNPEWFSVPLELTATCLIVTTAILTADFLTAKWRTEQSRPICWVGVIALVAGCTAQWYLPRLTRTSPEDWWHPWLLPSYGIGFLVCLVGRAIENRRLATSSA